MRFDHVGVLARELQAARGFAPDVLGLEAPADVRIDEFGLSPAFFPLGAGHLELLRFDAPGERPPSGQHVRIDHVAAEVDDLDAEAERLGARAVRFQGALRADQVQDPVDMRGRRRLWTKPETSGGSMVQLTERA